MTEPIGVRSAGALLLAVLLAAAAETPLGAQAEPMALVQPPGRYITDVAASENVESMVAAAIGATLIRGLETRDWGLAGSAFTDDFQGRFPPPGQGERIEDDLLVITRFDGASPVLTRDELLDVLREHVGPWTEVERVSWHNFEFLLEPSLERAFVKAHVQLGGPASGNRRSAVDATVVAEVIASAPDRWQIRRLDVVAGQRVDNPHPPFRDITDATGFHLNRSAANEALRQQVIDTRTNMSYGGLSVVDWNHDGFWDLIATESLNQSVLFLNDGRGGFVRGELPVDDPRLSPSMFLFVDLDNDGSEELVGNQVHLYEGERAWIGIHTRVDGEWLFRPRALAFDNPRGVRHTDMQIITAGDIDGDGDLDLFFGAYEGSESRDPERFNLIEAPDGDDNLRFVNHGGLRFTEESDARGITGTKYTFVAQFFDFDADGHLDLFAGNDYGRNVVWRNNGDGTFDAQPDHPLARRSNYTMGVTIADLENTGNWSVYLSNMYSHAGHRVVGLTRGLGDDTLDHLRLLASGNELFTAQSRDGVWVERATSLGVNQAGWAWGTVFVDLDNDGDKEIVVANGNTSYRDPEAPDF